MCFFILNLEKHIYKLKFLYMCFVLLRKWCIWKKYAIAYALKIAKQYKKEESIIVSLSGRGDKDMDTILNLGG